MSRARAVAVLNAAIRMAWLMSFVSVSSGSFLAIAWLSGKRAGQPLFSGWLGVLPKSAPGGVFVEFEELE